jgi:hypothetical protein
MAARRLRLTESERDALCSAAVEMLAGDLDEFWTDAKIGALGRAVTKLQEARRGS